MRVRNDQAALLPLTPTPLPLSEEAILGSRITDAAQILTSRIDLIEYMEMDQLCFFPSDGCGGDGQGLRTPFISFARDWQNDYTRTPDDRQRK
jgi:hypothetical protein